jgi:hypothetical protein
MFQRGLAALMRFNPESQNQFNKFDSAKTYVNKLAQEASQTIPVFVPVHVLLPF